MGIWETLSTIDCNAHIEKKGRFSYLAWTWAWAMVKERYPLARYSIEPDITYPDGTMEVRCTVTIEDLSHTMWLPVINSNNKAIVNPNAFDVNSSRMRCLVKCLAMFGLGHYIYAGESVPQQVDDAVAYTELQLEEFNTLLDSKNALKFAVFCRKVGPDVITALNRSFPEGKVSQGKKLVKDLDNEGWDILRAYAAEIAQATDKDDTMYLQQMATELSVDEKRVLAGILRPQDIEALQKARGLAV